MAPPNSSHAVPLAALLIALALMLSPLTTRAHTFISTGLMDSYVDQDAPGSNYGELPHVVVGISEFGSPARSYLIFPFDPNLADTRLRRATLNLYLADGRGADSVRLQVRPVTELWAAHDPDGLDWNSQPPLLTEIIDEQDVDNTPGWKQFDVTPLVRGWLDGTIANSGLLIRAADETGTPYYWRAFYSVDSAACNPYIEITYGSREPPLSSSDRPACALPTDAEPPVVTISAQPDPVPASRPVRVSAAASDNEGLHLVQLYRGLELVASRGLSGPAGTVAEDITLAPGVYTYTAYAWDGGMNSASTSMQLWVLEDDAPPDLEVWHSPREPEVGDLVTFHVRADDTSGIRDVALIANSQQIWSREPLSPAIDSVSEIINYTSGTAGYDVSGVRLIRYHARATGRDGQQTTTGIKYVLIGNSGTDSDGDGLSDMFEGLLGLLPWGADTDADGLYDGWEVMGFDADGDGEIDLDLPALGANPHHKDVFLEIDWMEDATRSEKLHPVGVQLVVNALRDYGLSLHVDQGHLGGGNPLTYEPVKTDPATEEEIDWNGDGVIAKQEEWHWLRAIKRHNFDPHRRGIFRYGAVTGDVGGKKASSGNLFLVGPRHKRPAAQGLTLMHELGHTLGLHHGGQQPSDERIVPTLGPDGRIVRVPIYWREDGDNNKPNYFSVMNYRYSSGPRVLTDSGELIYIAGFQTADDTLLDENSLDENIGLRAPALLQAYVWRRQEGTVPSQLATWRTRLEGLYYTVPHKAGVCHPVETEAWLADGDPVDWDFSDDIHPGLIARDINEFCRDREDDCDCSESQRTELHGRREIALLQPRMYGVIDFGFADMPLPVEDEPGVDVELATDGEYSDGVDNDGDERIDEGFPDADADGIVDMIDNCSLTSNPAQLDTDRNGIGDACQQPPGRPFGLALALRDATPILTWRALPAADLVGYNVYRRLPAEADFRRLASPYPSTLEASFADPECTAGTIYTLTGVDVYHQEGLMSAGLVAGDSDGDGVCDSVAARPANPYDPASPTAATSWFWWLLLLALIVLLLLAFVVKRGPVR